MINITFKSDYKDFDITPAISFNWDKDEEEPNYIFGIVICFAFWGIHIDFHKC